MDLLYASYDEGAYCMPVMMMSMPVMMRGPIDASYLLYASYDEPGPIVCQL